MTDDLIVERDGNVLVARINRPERKNSLSTALLGSLAAAVTEAESSDDIRVFLLTATGDSTFCAGMDLKEFAAGGGGLDPADLEAFNRLMYGRLEVPVVAAVNGTAVGGGLELLHGCDVIVAASTARFGLPEVKRGLFPAGAGTLLGTRIPLVVALELNLTGDFIDAARAYELGLINRVVEAADLMSTALDYARRIAANGPLGLRAVKELVRAAADGDAAIEARRAEWQRRVFASDDAREGATAFVEKRAPNWTGK
ncbi:MAG: enoyl-CoA hydratase/isomerase family protein [Frankiaceae bacterium]|nr:enoyl-CoA hydratase/isomerase family protein [Frankiaceae bacterium]MBV9872613.1 enoyl-CoA hydratase/isomerase family protein [Frankiaceae bacterium]